MQATMAITQATAEIETAAIEGKSFMATIEAEPSRYVATIPAAAEREIATRQESYMTTIEAVPYSYMTTIEDVPYSYMTTIPAPAEREIATINLNAIDVEAKLTAMEEAQAAAEGEAATIQAAAERETAAMERSHMTIEAVPYSYMMTIPEREIVTINLNAMDEEAMPSTMEERLAIVPKSELYTISRAISRVPVYVRQINEKLYEPMVISFGPYHHGSSHLQAMEKHKWRYLRDLLSRSTNGATLDDCLTKMQALEEEARSFYSESIDLTSDVFVEMMLLDACFIIELAFKVKAKDWGGINLGWGVDYIPWDLLLLENQIPFFIIQRLFDLVVGRSPSLGKVILSLYTRVSTLGMEIDLAEIPTEIHHLLHLYHHWFVASLKLSTGKINRCLPLEKLISLLFSPFSSNQSDDKMRRTAVIVIPCATELHDAGVRFKTKRKPKHLLDITFQEGVMEVPFFSVDDSIKPLFANLIAFEQSACSSAQRNMTSFCLLMDCLINTEKDVAFLQRCDVMENLLGNEDDVARFFNQLCRYAAQTNDHYLSEMFNQVNQYRDQKWNNYRAKLVHDYFSNPWAFLSLLAALVLLALTIAQTYFAAYAYFRP